MNDLNAKLAELRGMELRPIAGQMTISGVAPCWRKPEGGYITQSDWNPTQDLNQLKMCYEALSGNEMLRLALSLDSSNPLIVFDSPELVAHAILKAKGVS